jgi:hypothetical protein
VEFSPKLQPVATQSRAISTNRTVASLHKPSVEKALVSPAVFEPPWPSAPPAAAPKPLTSANPVIELLPVQPVDGPETNISEVIQRTAPPTPVPPPPTPQEIGPPQCEWLAQLWPLALRLADGSLAKADPQDLAAFVEQLNIALMPLRARAALEIPKLCFCRAVAAPARFGAYERLDDNHRFRPGETVAVYMELRNFACVPRDGDYATHVVSSVELHDANGKVVLRFDSDRSDPSLSPRHDYCHVGRFTLPALPPGAYTLWLKATDVPTGRSSRRSLDFRVASSASG